MNRKRIIIIGAGVSGLACGIEASGSAEVTILEHGREPLEKLLLTGNGRCNFSNTDLSVKHYHGDKELASSVIERFSVDDMLDFMSRCGIEPVEVHYRFNENGYFYPSTNSAKTVKDRLLQVFYENGGRIVTEETVQDVIACNGHFRILTDKKEYDCDRLIFACGSNAAPQTGSDSSIYPVLKKLGIGTIPYLPALCGITTQDPAVKRFSGMRCEADVVLTGKNGLQEDRSEYGEVQFANGYVSGIPVMQLSRYVSIGEKNGAEYSLSLHIKKWGNIRKDCGELPSELTIDCAGTRSFRYAQCCSGGVDTARVNRNTLEYQDIPGLFFAGEMLNVDGDCGGYNLHFAFGTGLIAGKASVK